MVTSNKERILHMYYEEHLRPVDISKILNIDSSYISRIVKKDERYSEEKQHRKDANKLKNRESAIKYTRASRKTKKEEYEALQHQLAMDAKEDSRHFGISNYNFRKFNSSAYNHNQSKNQFELNRFINAPKCFPEVIKY